MYPVMLNLRGKRCLVVGGGGVALRKVEGLLADGASVDVVATRVHPALQGLTARGEVALRERGYASGDIQGHALVFAATDDPVVNRAVFADERQNPEEDAVDTLLRQRLLLPRTPERTNRTARRAG